MSKRCKSASSPRSSWRASQRKRTIAAVTDRARQLLLFLCIVMLSGCDGAEAQREEPRAEPTQAPVPAPTEALEPAVAEPPADLKRALVKLVVLGEFDDALAEAVAQGLRDELQVEVEMISGEPLPRRAYYRPRRRYRAERLLDHLRQRLEGAPASVRVLGLTSVDISTTKGNVRDWGILGLGDIGGRACVISSFRMRRRGLRDQAHLRFRVVSTAIHEVGHTLGLEHCLEPRGVMNDARGTIRTVDQSSGHLGPECRAELDREEPRRFDFSQATEASP